MTHVKVAVISFVTMLFAASPVHHLGASHLVEQQDSKPAATASSSPQPKGAIRTLTGTALDSKGQRVTKGQIWLPVKWLNPWEVLTASSNFQASVPFQLTFPEEWIPSDQTMRNSIVWAYAPGHAIGTGDANGQLFGTGLAKPFTIELPPAGNLSFVVLLSNGNPAIGARVEPSHFKTQRGYEPVPQALVDHVAGTTDAKGRAAMPALTRDGIYTINVKMAGFGIQQFRCDMKSTDAPERTLQLRDVGRLEGRILAAQPDLARNAVISIETSALGNARDLRQATGVAIVKVDHQGRFVIPEIANGRVEVMARCDERLPVRARLPERGSITLLTAETRNIDIPLEKAVRVHGIVRAKDTQRPLSGVKVVLSYGVGQQADSAITNEKGEYSIPGLAGKAYVQLISIPHGYLQSGEPWRDQQVIPADAEEYSWPAIEVVPSTQVVGRLVDRDGKPMANVRINGGVGNRRYGFGSSDQNGSFTLSGVPQGLKLEQFEIWTRDEHFIGIVETQEPLVVRVKN